MPSRPRGLVSAVAALAVALTMIAAAPSANGTRVPPGPEGSTPVFTHAQAQAVLAKAHRQLRRDTRRLRARRPVGDGVGTDITMTLRDLYLARTTLTGDERREADAILARPSDTGGDNLGGGDSVDYGANTVYHYCPSGGVACIHWVAAGPEKLSASQISTDVNANGTPDYVETVYATVAHVLAYEHGVLGYKSPLADGGTSGDNPDTTIDIYLANLGPRGLYGYCAPDDAFSGRHVPGYCVLDNDYRQAEYGSANYLNPLRVTAAHELFHAIQFAYDVGEDLWFMEGTATWVEDEVYDAINDNLQFLPESPIRFPWAPADLTVDFHRYGSWILFRFASEFYRDRRIVRRMWELADAGTSSRYSLQAVRAAVSARGSWAWFAVNFAAWNSRQPHGYSEASIYPTPRWIRTAVLSQRHRSTGWVTSYLPHFSSGPIRVIPSPKLAPRKRLRIEADLPPAARGSALLVQQRLRSGGVVNRLMHLNRKGDGHVRIGFNRKVVSSVALFPANTNTSMVLCGYIAGSDGGPAYSCSGRGAYDYGQKYRVRAKVS